MTDGQLSHKASTEFEKIIKESNLGSQDCTPAKSSNMQRHSGQTAAHLKHV